MKMATWQNGLCCGLQSRLYRFNSGRGLKYRILNLEFRIKKFYSFLFIKRAGVEKLVYSRDLKSFVARHAGSSPAPGTRKEKSKSFGSPRFTRQPQKEKIFLAFGILAGWIFLKCKGYFFGFCLPSIQAGGGTMRTKFWQNYFLGKGFFALPRLIFRGKFEFGFRPQKGVWGMNVGGILFEIWRLLLFL